MAFITAPVLPIRSIQWSLERPAQINVSAWTGKRTVVANPWYSKWRARVELAPIVGEANVRAIRSFLARCRGSINTFRLYATEGDQNANDAVTVSATAAAGATSMAITGAETALLDGQLVTVNGQLLQLTADQSGSTISFEPPLRAQAAAGTAVVTGRPYALVHMAAAQAGWGVDPGQVYGIAFDVEEAILEADGAAPETGVLPANTAAPVVSGTPTEGQTLSVTNGTWSGSPTFSYQWKRDGVAIYGAAASTYVLRASDVGFSISAAVTGTNASGSRTATSNSVGPVAASAPPVNTAAPAVTGISAVGNALSVTNGTWTGALSFTRQWRRNGTPIAGATGTTYRLVAADEGATIDAVVTATNSYGIAAAASNRVGPVALDTLDLNFAAQTYKVGATTYGAWSAVPGYSFTRTGEQGAVDASGAVQWFAANTPAIDSAGYHAYGALTNLLLNSQALDSASWAQINATVTPDAVVAPDNTTTADKVIPNTGNAAEHGVYVLNTTVAAAKVYTYSVIAKAAGYGGLQFTVIDNDAAGGGGFNANFNLDTGTVVDTGTSNLGAYIIPLGNGWYRCVVVSTANDTTADCRLYVGPTANLSMGAGNKFSSFSGDGTSGVLLWQIQMVAGNFSDGGPLIRTTTATASIGASSLAVSLANGTYSATYTFDDNSTQTIPTTIAGGSYAHPVHPATLNRGIVKRTKVRL